MTSERVRKSKVMIAVSHADVAPRFDLTLEAVIAAVAEGGVEGEPRVLLISEPSGDELCALAVREGAELVVCGGIDEVHFDYLGWKQIRVIDGVIGPWQQALEQLAEGRLEPGAILSGAVSP